MVQRPDEPSRRKPDAWMNRRRRAIARGLCAGDPRPGGPAVRRLRRAGLARRRRLLGPLGTTWRTWCRKRSWPRRARRRLRPPRLAVALAVGHRPPARGPALPQAGAPRSGSPGPATWLRGQPTGRLFGGSKARSRSAGGDLAAAELATLVRAALTELPAEYGDPADRQVPRRRSVEQIAARERQQRTSPSAPSWPGPGEAFRNAFASYAPDMTAGTEKRPDHEPAR